VFREQPRKPVDVAQGRAQVVGDRIGEGLEFLVGRGELGGVFANAPFQLCVFHAQPPHGQRAREHRHNVAQFEGLQDVIERATLHGLDGRVNAAMAGHDNAYEVGVHFQRRSEQRDTVHFGHH
jgi:hypothetical protein